VNLPGWWARARNSAEIELRENGTFNPRFQWNVVKTHIRKYASLEHRSIDQHHFFSIDSYVYVVLGYAIGLNHTFYLDTICGVMSPLNSSGKMLMPFSMHFKSCTIKKKAKNCVRFYIILFYHDFCPPFQDVIKKNSYFIKKLTVYQNLCIILTWQIQFSCIYPHQTPGMVFF